MPPSSAPLFLGQPQFADAATAALQKQQGAAAAWSAALAGDAAQALRRIGGSFAIGLQIGQRTVLAVDRFAIESLCFRVDGEQLRFAERADALVEPGAALQPQALFDYLYFHAIPSPRTVFAGVQRLPPGHMAVFENGRLTVSRYWTPEFVEPAAASFGSLRDEFMRLVEQAVATEFGNQGGKVACFLSGGTDSSTVAGMLGRVSGAPAEAYSIGFEAEGYDEMAYARIAAKHFGVRHHEHYVTPGELVRHIPRLAAHLDQPFGNSSALPAHLCAALARADGMDKLLAGDGGDELFGGNSRYAKQRVFGWYREVPGLLRSGLLEPLFDNSAMARVPLLKKGSSYIEQAKVAMPDRLQMYNLLRRLGVADVLTPAFIAAVDQQAPLALQRKVWSQAASPHEINLMLAFDWRFTLAESDLPKVRAATQLAGIQVGYPLLDTALLDFSLRLPAQYKLKGLKLRWFFKEALRGFLPDAIITKKKHGFGLPFGTWAMRDVALQQLATDSLRSLAARGVVRADFIRALCDELLPQHPGYYGEMVWILMMLEQWLQQHHADWRL